MISLLRHDQGMQNYSWSHILDNPKTARNTIICSKYREQWEIYSTSRPSLGTSCITGWQALVGSLMTGENMGSTVQCIGVGIPARTVNRWLRFSWTPIPHIHTFNNYFLRDFCVSDCVAGPGNTTVSGKRSNVCPREASLVRETQH